MNIEKILTPEAQQFLKLLHQTFNKRRLQLLEARVVRQKQIDQGTLPNFLPETANIRNNPNWKVAKAPPDLQKRWVEITGPTDRKMMINALNSGADVFMADFEDANAPAWQNMIDGQANLMDAVRGTLSFTSPDGKQYSLNDRTAVLTVRPRGWHLYENNMVIDGEAMSASLFDFGLAFFHNAKTLLKKGSGPYFYLPKMESHLEARLWNDVFVLSQKELDIPQGTIRATVLIETILAVFEMQEILYELREHSAGLNAGRWDYIFSIIKKFQNKKDFVFPARSQITMTVPFMRAYTQLLVYTCHSRGAFAMGGMAAFVPSRKDKAVNDLALAKVREDKIRESTDGFDGTWVAHPDLVPIAHEIFAKELHNQPNQLNRAAKDPHVDAKALLNFKIPGGTITEQGIRQNISVGLQYINSWLSGVGAVAINNLMEDAATAEISRAQLWQWVHHTAVLDDGRPITADLYRMITDEELNKLVKDHPERKQKLEEARRLLDDLVLDRTFADFLTIEASEYLNIH